MGNLILAHKIIERNRQQPVNSQYNRRDDKISNRSLDDNISIKKIMLYGHIYDVKDGKLFEAETHPNYIEKLALLQVANAVYSSLSAGHLNLEIGVNWSNIDGENVVPHESNTVH